MGTCSRSSRFEIHRITAEGLVAVLDVPLYGRLTNMTLIRPKACGTFHPLHLTLPYFCSPPAFQL